jgi:hypothetical protein
MTVRTILTSRFDLSGKYNVSGPLIKSVVVWIFLYGKKPFQISDMAYSLNTSERSIFRVLAFLEERRCIKRNRVGAEKTEGEPRTVIKLIKLPTISPTYSVRANLYL